VDSVWLHQVTPGLFDALGVIPPLGRPLSEGDGVTGVPAAAVVAWPLATRWFGEPARAVGQTIRTGDEVIRIVGVMPDGFRFPTQREEVWTALRRDPSRPFGMSVGWLAPGVTPATVQSALDGRRVGPDDETGPVGPLRVVPLTRAMHDPRVRTNSGAYTGATAPALFTFLFAAAICLTAVSSLNLAGLSLASALTRAHVHAVQTALGATRSLLVRVALLEAWALTLAGAAAGYVAARWSTAAMQAAMPSPLEALLLNAIDVDVRAVWFMALATATTGMLACAPLVWLTSRGGLTDALRRSSRTASASRTHVAWRHGIVGVQAAMTVVLLSGAVVFLRPFISDFAADQQFDTTGLVTINVAESSDVSREERDRTRNRLHERVLETLRAHPLVRSVAPVSEVPPGVGRATPPSHLWIAGHAASAGLIHLASINGGEGSLDTLGVRLLAGRAFQAGDTADRVIVDIEFARRFWPAGNALGARFSTGTETTPGKNTREIIGIASHLRPGRAWSGQPVFVVHSLSPPRLSYAARLHRTAAMEAVAAAVRQIAPGARATVRSVADEYADMDGDTRIAVSLASSFAAIALVVAIAGIYGVTAFVVAGRTREIGIRLALGATPPDIRRSIVRPTMRVVGLGLGAGVGLALLTSRWIESLPLGVTGAGAAASVAIALGVGAAAILAARRPAGRASRVNPAITLRAE
jgi:predicted permease